MSTEKDTTSSGTGGFALTSIVRLEEARQWMTWSREIKDWMILNNYWEPKEKDKLKACTALLTRCGTNARTSVEHLPTPKEIFESLEKQFKPQGSGLFAELTQELINLRKAQDISIDEYGRRHQEIITEIEMIDPALKLPKHFTIQLFLSGLGESWQTWYSILAQTSVWWGEKALSLQDVMAKARAEEQRATVRTTNVAMWSQQKAAPRGGTGTKRSFDDTRERPTCQHCTTKGRNNKHAEDKCWDLYPEKKPAKFRAKKAKTEGGDTPVQVSSLSVTDSYSLTSV